MGCLRDKLSLELFVSNLVAFQNKTGATVAIVSQDQKARRILRRGLSHDEFLNRIEILLKSQQPSDAIHSTHAQTTKVTQL